MPVAKVTTGDKPISIWYDLYGRATEEEDIDSQDLACTLSEEDVNCLHEGLELRSLSGGREVEAASSASPGSVCQHNSKERSREPDCRHVVFIAGVSARGRTEFFQHMVEHLASLKDADGQPMLSVATFDNRGIGGSTVPTLTREYTTRLMAQDTLTLIDFLGWRTVHLVGLSLGGMIACKLAAMRPDRIASLTVLGTVTSGWQMLASISTKPLLALKAGLGPLQTRIPANLRYNFTEAYLKEQVGEEGQTRMQVLVENTNAAIREGDTAKFLAEGQPDIGRQGHLRAVGTHRMSDSEMRTLRDAAFPLQVINGRHDTIARPYYVQRMTRRLRCTLLITEAAHAGIMIEAMSPIVPLLENIILDKTQSSALHIKHMNSAAKSRALQDRLFARELATSFGPAKVSYKTADASKENLTKAEE